MQENIKKSGRIGEKRTMLNGQTAEIIEYFNKDDITVRWSDGTITPHKKYRNFANNSLDNPNFSLGDYQRKQRLGKKYKTYEGLDVTIVDYKNQYDIDVMYNNGYVYKHRKYQIVSKNHTRTPLEALPGLTSKDTDGNPIVILSALDKKRLTVEFQSGEIKKDNCHLTDFIAGRLRDPALSKVNHVGEKSESIDGIPLTISRYNKQDDMDVSLPNGNTFRAAYQNFIKKKLIVPIELTEGLESETIYGQPIKIIKGEKRGRSRRIDILLLNENIVLYNRPWTDFVKKTIVSDAEKKTIAKKQHIGETCMANCGMLMTITEYQSAASVKVKFEDGYETTATYTNFKNGRISNPNVLNRKYKIGYTFMTNCGLFATIEAYMKDGLYKFRFEDGEEAAGESKMITRGNIKHSVLKKNKILIYHGYKAVSAYTDDNGYVWYRTVNLSTGEKALMTPQMMLGNDPPRTRSGD